MMSGEGWTFKAKFHFREDGSAIEKLLQSWFPGGWTLVVTFVASPCAKLVACIQFMDRKEITSSMALVTPQLCLNVERCGMTMDLAESALEPVVRSPEKQRQDTDEKQDPNNLEIPSTSRQVLQWDGDRLVMRDDSITPLGHEVQEPEQEQAGLGEAIAAGLLTAKKPKKKAVYRLFLKISCMLEMKVGKDLLKLEAYLKIKPTAIILGADLHGLWNNPFGIPMLTIGNLRIQVPPCSTTRCSTTPCSVPPCSVLPCSMLPPALTCLHGQHRS